MRRASIPELLICLRDAWEGYQEAVASEAKMGATRDATLRESDRLTAENARLRKALKSIGGFVAIRPRGDPGSYQRGFDIGFNGAGQAAAYIANQALEQP